MAGQKWTTAIPALWREAVQGFGQFQIQSNLLKSFFRDLACCFSGVRFQAYRRGETLKYFRARLVSLGFRLCWKR